MNSLNDFKFSIMVGNVLYSPKPTSGQFEITRKEVTGNKVRVWGTLNCELEVVTNHPMATGGILKDAVFVVEFLKEEQ